MQAPRFDYMSSLGEAFRAAREARGLSLSDVAEQIHIRSVYLASIEAEDWAAIGAPVYVRGFIRTYARFLGLDAEAAVARFSEWSAGERADAPAPSSLPASGSGDRGGPSVWVIAGVLVAIVLVAFAGYEYYQYQSGPGTVAVELPPTPPAQNAQTAAPVDSDSPSPEPTAARADASASPAAHNQLDLRLTARCWLRVAVDGKVEMEGLFPAGTVRTLTGKTATIRAGNAAGVDVTVNGKNVGALGGSGDVVERSFNLTGE